MTDTNEPTRLTGRQVTLIWEIEFSDLVRKIYGRPYQFQQQGDMMGQDTIYRFSVPATPLGDHWQAVPFQQWLDADPPTPATDGGFDRDRFSEELRWDREFYPEVEDVINDLHRRGLIDEGEYAMHVWW